MAYRAAADLPAAAHIFMTAELLEARAASAETLEEFCARHGLDPVHRQAAELHSRYRELWRIVNEPWALNLGGRL